MVAALELLVEPEQLGASALPSFDRNRAIDGVRGLELGDTPHDETKLGAIAWGDRAQAIERTGSRADVAPRTGTNNGPWRLRLTSMQAAPRARVVQARSGRLI